MKITDHFDSVEFACRDGVPYPVEWIDDWLRPLCAMLETIRTSVNGPILILSGFRTLDYDQKLYDADRGRGNVAPPQGSQHPQGRAADISTSLLAPFDLRNLIGALFQVGNIPQLGGLGLYPTFVHVDIRDRGPSNHLAQWGGTRITNIA